MISKIIIIYLYILFPTSFGGASQKWVECDESREVRGVVKVDAVEVNLVVLVHAPRPVLRQGLAEVSLDAAVGRGLGTLAHEVIHFHFFHLLIKTPTKQNKISFRKLVKRIIMWPLFVDI